MNTEENNKMIAEFMGARPIVFSGGTKGHTFWNDDFDGEGRYGAFPDGATNYFEYDKGYHTSWDWLMPVVEKIESFQDGEDGDSMRGHLYNFRIEQHFVYILDGESMDVIIEMNGDSKLDATYQGVVEFINQYNNNESAD